MASLLKNIQENEVFDLLVLVASKAKMSSKAGRDYLSLRLVDKSGSVDARIWDHISELSACFEANDMVRVKGKMVRHQGQLQAHLVDVERLTGEIDYRSILPASEKDSEAMFAELLSLVRTSVSDPWVRAILLKIFEDPTVAAAYKQSPAAKTHHHAYLGGLLEHSLGLAKMGLSVLPHYPKIDASLVIAGLLLHDIGKIYELSYVDGFRYTVSGKLVGHLVMGVELISEKAREIPDFPEDVLLHLKHLIVGHHGQIEFGSPVLPQTLEAILVHFLDNMDSKLAGMEAHLEREAEVPGDWTSFNAMYGRTMYKTPPFRRAVKK